MTDRKFICRGIKKWAVVYRWKHSWRKWTIQAEHEEFLSAITGPMTNEKKWLGMCEISKWALVDMHKTGLSAATNPGKFKCIL